MGGGVRLRRRTPADPRLVPKVLPVGGPEALPEVCGIFLFLIDRFGDEDWASGVCV